jgi:phospholipid transport system substrate-binding protein
MQATHWGCALFLAAAVAASPSFARDQAPEAVLKEAAAQQRVLPLFDFARMTETVVARNWRRASPEQQKRLTAEFGTLVARTYAAALANQSGHKRVTIDYDMEKTADGWKIYDIKLHGVSLIATYRESFAEAVRERGLNGLVGLLSADNRRGGAFVWTGGAAPRGESLIALAVLYSALQGRR